MGNLIFKRKKRVPLDAPGQVVNKVNSDSYNKVLELADELENHLERLFQGW